MSRTAAAGPHAGWLAVLLRGQPHEVIYNHGTAYLQRRYLIPRNRICNIYLHRFLASDPSVPHDHPWPFLSIVLRNSYREVTETGGVVRRPGSIACRRATTRHRVELLGAAVTTVIITGPRCRPWGFWCPRRGQPARFVPWQQFASAGCGEFLTPTTQKEARSA